MDIVVYTNCKSLEAALKSAGCVKNRMLMIDLTQIKEKIDKGAVKVVKWIDRKEQLADSLTKRKSNKRAIIEEVQGLRERGRIRISLSGYMCLFYILIFNNRKK